MDDPSRARWLLAVVVACALPALTSGLSCCDVKNYRRIESANQSYFGIPAIMYRANQSNTRRCNIGTQCVPCTAPSTRAVNLRDVMGLQECGLCSDEGQGGGVCAPCMLGDFCPEGTVNPFMWTNANICPDGKRCTPDLSISMNGFLLDIQLEYNVTPCPEGYICPAGTPEVSDILDCQKLWVDFLGPKLSAFANEDEGGPPGRQDNSTRSMRASGGNSTEAAGDNSTIPEDTPSGYYCKEGSSGFESIVKERQRLFQECEEGFYCPTTRESYPCPDGKFCKALYSKPDACPGMDSCDGLESKQPDFVWSRMTWMIALYVVLLILGGLLQARFQRNAERTKAKQETVLLDMDKLNFVQQALWKIGNIHIELGKSAFKPPPTSVTIEFQHLSLSVTAGSARKTVLNDVVGQFEHSRMAGIMGPSGCGKSTLLNVLSGRAVYGQQEGTTLINGQPGDIMSLKNVTGFVPQDDTVFGDLTVYENIYYSGKLRLPTSMSKAEKQALISQVISQLQLTPLTASIVGTVEKRGISGGQKKRVNIGVEMAADPTLLFLDEPTSGLAATDTSLVMQVLHEFTGAGRTVVAVIHQPRYAVFSLFHDIVFMYPGGHVVYFGPFENVEPYFSGLTFNVPRTENPADYYIDVISGEVPHLTDPAWRASDLPGAWAEITKSALDEAENAPVSPTTPATPATPAKPNLNGALERHLTSTGSFLTSRRAQNNWGLARARLLANKGDGEGIKGLVSMVYEQKWTESSTPETDPIIRNMGGYMEAAFKSVRTESIRRTAQGEADNAVSPDSPAGSMPCANIISLKRYFVARGLDPHAVNEFMDMMDKSGDGIISKKDFMNDIMDAVSKYRKKTLATSKGDVAKGQKGTFRSDLLVPFHLQLLHLTKRVATQKLRVFQEVMANLTLLMVAGLLVGLLVGADHQPFKPTDANLSLMITLIMTVNVTLSAVSAIKVFGGTEIKIMVDRQRRAGVNMMALYLSKVLVDLVENIWQPLFFLGISYNYVVPVMEFKDFYLTLVALSFASSGIGIIISLFLKPSGQSLAAVLWSLITSIFMNGAIGVKYSSIKASGGQFLWALMPPRWGQEMLTVNELRASSSELYHNVVMEEVVLYFGYFPVWETEESYYGPRTREEQVDGFRDYLDSYQLRNYLIIFGIGVGLRLIGCLIFTNPLSTTSLFSAAFEYGKDKCGKLLARMANPILDVVDRGEEAISHTTATTPAGAEKEKGKEAENLDPDMPLPDHSEEVVLEMRPMGSAPAESARPAQ